MDDTNAKPEADLRLVAADVVSNYVSNNTLPAAEVPDLIRKIHAALSELGSGTTVEAPRAQTPAVTVRRSVQPDGISCLECGRKLKTLKRHLQADHGLSPSDYRVKWSLPGDYPMVAPSYAAERSAMAKKIGLGRKPGARRRRKSA